MEHPERFPTPNISPHISPASTPRTSHYIEPNESDDDGDELPPPYSRVIPMNETPMDLDMGASGTDSNGQQLHGNVEQTLAVNHNNDIETVTVHNNPISTDEDREIGRNSISENERTVGISANRRKSYGIASRDNPVSSTDCTLDSNDPVDTEGNFIHSNDRHSLENSTDGCDMCVNASSIVDGNNEIIGRLHDELHDSSEINGGVSGRNHGPTLDHSTQTDRVTRGNSSGHLEVWL
jgi:hypothetical protein